MANTRWDEPLRCWHVAFILKRNKIISIGVNVNKTHPWNLKYKYDSYKTGTCAELAAVIKSKSEDHCNHTMIVTRVNRNGILDNSRPCKGCQFLINQLKFKEVWFTNSNGEYQKL